MNNRIIDIQCMGIECMEKEEKIRLLCDNIFDILDIDNWELSIVLSDDVFIRELNRDYRGMDEPTDVLSFPQTETLFPAQQDGIKYAGDIIISVDTLERNSAEFNVDINEEFTRLLIHGILHLGGYTHEDNSPQQPMLVIQENVLAKITGVDIF